MGGAGDPTVMEGEAGEAGERPEPGFAGVESVLEGVGAAELPARARRGGHDRYPFGTRVEGLRVEKAANLIIAQMFCLSTGKKRGRDLARKCRR